MSPPPVDPADFEACVFCGREAEDVTFDYLGPDPNDITGEYWDLSCGPDKGCSMLEPGVVPS